MMVKQTRHIFEFKDILTVRIQCASEDCQSEYVLPLGNIGIPLTCPSCETGWMPRNGSSLNTERLLRALKSILQFPDQTINLRFEINGEDEC